MRLGQLIEELSNIEKKNGPDLEVELVTGHRTDEYEMIMDDTASVKVGPSQSDGTWCVIVRACDERSYYYNKR